MKKNKNLSRSYRTVLYTILWLQFIVSAANEDPMASFVTTANHDYYCDTNNITITELETGTNVVALATKIPMEVANLQLDFTHNPLRRE